MRRAALRIEVPSVSALRKFLRLPSKNRRMLVTALFVVALIRLGLKALPFQKLLVLLNRLAERPRGWKDPDPLYERRVLWAVSAAARRLLRNNPCLTQAMAVQLLFRRNGLPAELHVGVAKDEQGLLKAHAWVESNDEVVIGGAASPFEYRAFPSLDLAGK